MVPATFRKTPISLSTLYKKSMPGHLFECNPVDELTTRRGTNTPAASSGKTRRFPIQLNKWVVTQ